MSARKYKHYIVEESDRKSDTHSTIKQTKKEIQLLKEKISHKLSEDLNLQKRAALILEKMINSK